MKTRSTRPAFSMLSTSLLLIAMGGALLGLMWGYPSIRIAADWVCGISVVALLASLVNDARKR